MTLDSDKGDEDSDEPIEIGKNGDLFVMICVHWDSDKEMRIVMNSLKLEKSGNLFLNDYLQLDNELSSRNLEF